MQTVAKHLFLRVTLASVTALAACPNRTVAEIDPRQETQTHQVVRVQQNRDLDILFVIDNSGSMGDEQQSLIDNFPGFMATLRAIEGGLPNVHVGVVSSNVGAGGYSWRGSCDGDGDDGLLQNTARGACAPPSGQFIEDIAIDDAGTRQRNYSGTLEDSFKCIANLGTGGCGLEHHMESMRRALDGSRVENKDFLRPDAFLGVVFIADEDDCSASDGELFNDDPALDNAGSSIGPRALRCTEWAISCDGANLPRAAGSYTDCEPRQDSPYFQDPKVYADFLRGLKARPDEQILLAGIFGPIHDFKIGDGGTGNRDNLHLLPSCGSDTIGAMVGDGAVPPIRFKALLDEFGDNSITTSICDANLNGALVTIAKKLAEQIGTSCMSAEADMTDIHPELTGLQPDCSVVEADKSLPRCKMLDQPGVPTPDPASPQPCWYIGEADSCKVTTPQGYTIEVARTGTPPSDGAVIVNCVGI